MITIKEKVKRLDVQMKRFRIDHPRLTEGIERLDAMREAGLESKGEPQLILPIIGPSGSGKTTTVLAWRDDIAEREGRARTEAHKILMVKLSANANVKQLGADIFHALGENGLPREVVADMLGRQGTRLGRPIDPLADLKAPQIMHAAATALSLAGTEYLVIDEIHHLVHKDTGRATKWSVSETLKSLADSGVCPIAVVGTYEARCLLTAENNDQFVQRCAEPISLDPLDISYGDECELFAGYITALGTKFAEHGIFPDDQRFDREDFIACFYDLSGGVIGRASRLARIAGEITIRRGSEMIERQDLSRAVRRWAIPFKITDHDPWANGPRDFKVSRMN